MAKGFDYGKLEDDMSAPVAKAVKPAPVVKPRPDPRDANVFTADKGIQPPMDDEGPTMDRKVIRKATGGELATAVTPPPGKPVRKEATTAKKGGKVCGMKKGGTAKSSASKRADGIAMRGKTKGRII